MKKLLTFLLTIMLTFSIANSADVYTGLEIGSVLTDGGSGHMAISPFFEGNIKSADSYINKFRVGYIQHRNADPEVQALTVWNINQIVLTEKWSPYVAIGFGGQNEVNPGDDILRGGGMLEFGCKLFDKVPFGLGGKLLPVNDRGDQVFIYGMLNISL